jgi:hypothetical protein
MKKIQFFISLFIMTILLGCTSDSNDVNLDELAAPSSISALMTIKQDNSGKVTITPRGENVSQYEVYFGDGTTEPAIVNPGASVTHTYPENPVNEPFQVRIIGMTINGKTTEVIQPLEVSFLAPTDLVATIAHVIGDNFAITVTATANLETYFQVYFGDSPTEVPVDFMDGETVPHSYLENGTYQVRVVALTGGAAYAEYIESVVIYNPIGAETLALPLTFESSNLVYTFGNFGSATSTIIANPQVSGINQSSKVASFVKANGAQTWAGSSILLASPINFSVMQKIKMKVWSPAAGKVVKLKLEKINATNPDPTNVEVDATTTVANGWEELTFNFAGINNANNYQRVVFFFDFGNAGNGATYYYDDITQFN